MSYTYLTTEELSERIKYDPRTIRNCLKDSVLIEGVHYIRPFGGRKILYLWEKIEKDMARPVSIDIIDVWCHLETNDGFHSFQIGEALLRLSLSRGALSGTNQTVKQSGKSQTGYDDSGTHRSGDTGRNI